MTKFRYALVLSAIAISLGGVTQQAAAATTTPCSQTLSVGANIASAVANAANDSTICLNSGNYGSVDFNSISRSGYVTLRSTSGVGANIAINVNYSKYIKFQNLTATGGQILGCAQNIQVLDSTFTNGLLVMSVGCGVPLNVLLDGNQFGDIGQALYEGRLSIRGDSGTKPIGVTVTNNRFGPGCKSDGIQVVGSTANLAIGPGNVFDGIIQAGAVHCDSIQFYGDGRDNVVTGNLFRNSSVALQHQASGTEPTHTVFTNNVISNVNQLQVGNSADFVFEHNTVYNLTDVFRFNTEPSSNVSYRSNIVMGNTAGPPGGTATSAYNLCTSSALCGGSSNAVVGTPSFVGGSPASISTLAGWQLAAGSVGKGAGHDGQDIGAVSAAAQLPAPPTNLRVLP